MESPGIFNKRTIYILIIMAVMVWGFFILYIVYQQLF